MAGRPTRLRNDRAHQAKPYEKRTSVLQSMVSAVRALIPSFLSESVATERQEMANGEREQPPWVPLESPRLMRDCAVGTDNEDEVEPVNFSMSPPQPERPLERPLERPASTPSPSSWMSLAASSHKRPKLYHEENPLQSPFYSGQTTYGGAAAQNRLRLLATSQTPAVPVVVRGVKPGGAASGLSNTTRHMLATLEKMATPVAEAKRVPLHRRVPGSGLPWAMRTPSPTLSQGGPPVRGAARPTVGWAAQRRPENSRLTGTDSSSSSRVESPRADAVRVEASRMEAPRPKALSRAPTVQEPQQTTLAAPKVEASRVSAPSTLPAIPWEPPSKMRATDRTSGGGKMVRVIHAACHPAPIRVGGPAAVQEDELPPAVPLPPIQSLPSFSFCLKPQESPSASTSTSTGSTNTPNATTAPAEFSFSKPEPIGEASTLSLSPPKSDQVFRFSEPWGPYGEDKSQKGKDQVDATAQETPKPQDTANAKVGSPAAAASPALAGSVASVQNKAEDSKKKAEASGTEDAKDGTTKGVNDLWERFKPPTGSWSCSSCMLSNPSSASCCQACEEPKPGAALSTVAGAAAPSTAPSTAPPLKPLAAVAAAQAPLWECDTCLVRNQPGALRCCACETPRPPPANGLAASSAAATAAAAAFSFTLAPARGTGFGGAPSSMGDTSAKPIKFGITTDGPAEPGTTTEASAKTFKLGITAGAPVKPAEPCASTEALAKSLKFGTAAEDSSKTFKFGSTTEEASKAIKFGTPTEEPSKSFKFGGAAEPPKAPSFGAATEDPAKGVKFGTAATEPARGIKRGATVEEPAKFNFGSPADQPARAFKLGCATEAKSPQTSTAAEDTARTFKFGSDQVEPAKTSQLGSTTGGFTFGSDSKELAKPFAFGSAPQQVTAGFKFGSSTQEPAKQPFTFGSSEEPQPAKAFKFGATSEEPAQPFKFGTATTEPSKFGSVADAPAKPLFTFGSSAATSAVAATPTPFAFGMAEKPGNTPSTVATEPCTTAVPPLASSQDGGSKHLPSLLPMAAPAMPTSMPSTEAPKPAYSSPFVFGAKTESTPSSFMFGTQQPAAGFPTPNGGAAASLSPFGALAAKPPEPQPVQPLFGTGLATTAFAVPTLKPTVTSTVAGFGSGFAPPVPAAPGQSSFVFRPQTTAPPATFQFGSTGPTSSSVFRFGAQSSQPATTLQQPQQQQPASEGFGTPFGQASPMGFNAPPPPFPMMGENPFSATGTGGGPSQPQRRIRKAVRRTKPNAR